MMHYKKLASLKSSLGEIGLTKFSLAIGLLLKQAAPKAQDLINQLSAKYEGKMIGGHIVGSIEALRNKPKYLEWIAIRFLDNPQYEELHDPDDSMAVLTSFAVKEAAVAEKFKSSKEFRTNLAELIPGKTFSVATFSNTMDKTFLSLSSDNLNDILALANRNRGAIDYGPPIPDEKDLVGKVGRWNLWMPTSKANSCKIAGYDRLTLEPKTSWCTARTSGENLFYNYTGLKRGQSINLFYVIADNPTTDDDWLSVGFIDGRPVLEGRSGSISVTRNQRGLTPELLSDILDSDYDQIMKVLSDHDDKIGDNNPAKIEILEAAKSVPKLIEMTRGLSAEAKNDIFGNIAESELSDEVMDYIFDRSSDIELKAKIASHDIRKYSALIEGLSEDQKQEVIGHVVDAGPNIEVTDLIYNSIPDDKLKAEITIDSAMANKLLEQHNFRNEIEIGRAIRIVEDSSELYEWFLDQSSRIENMDYGINSKNKQKALDVFEKNYGPIPNRPSINVDNFIKENAEKFDDLDVNVALNRAASAERESSTYDSIIRTLQDALKVFGEVGIEAGTGITLNVDIKHIINELSDQFGGRLKCKIKVVSWLYGETSDHYNVVENILNDLRDDELISAEPINFQRASDPSFDSEYFNEVLSSELDELL